MNDFFLYSIIISAISLAIIYMIKRYVLTLLFGALSAVLLFTNSPSDESESNKDNIIHDTTLSQDESIDEQSHETVILSEVPHKKYVQQKGDTTYVYVVLLDEDKSP